MERIILLILLFPLGMSGQNLDYQSYPITLCAEAVQEGNFYVYQPAFKAKGVYSKLEEVKNEYPEQVLQSMMSAISQEWVDFNTYGGAEKSRKKSKSFFEKAKANNREKNYYELIGKFTFSRDGKRYAVIKSYLHVEGMDERFPSALLFVREGNRWYAKKGREEAMIIYFFANFQLQTIKAIIENEETDDAFVTKCQKAMHQDGFFDFNPAPSLLGQLKMSKDITGIKKHLEWVHWPKN